MANRIVERLECKKALIGQCVLGVDPGLQITGYGVLELTAVGPRLKEAGVVRGRARWPLDRRLRELHEGILEVLEAFKPVAMALEELYSHYQRPRTAILMGHARGVICLAASQCKIPVIPYGATQIKKVLTGNGRAPKLQMQRAVSRELGLAGPPEPPDVADALAIALCHAHLGMPRPAPAVNRSRLT